jgi:rRNA maturation RNase YbeY
MIRVIPHGKVKIRREFARRLENLLKRVLEGEKIKKRVTVILLDNSEIKKLNLNYLGRDEPTDVLAFPLGDENEIYVSVEMAEDDRDIVHFAIHGLLHLLGYDHHNKDEGKLMREKEKKYLLLWEKS